MGILGVSMACFKSGLLRPADAEIAAFRTPVVASVTKCWQKHGTIIAAVQAQNWNGGSATHGNS
jgi:hypothetical protein